MSGGANLGGGSLQYTANSHTCMLFGDYKVLRLSFRL